MLQEVSLESVRYFTFHISYSSKNNDTREKIQYHAFNVLRYQTGAQLNSFFYSQLYLHVHRYFILCLFNTKMCSFAQDKPQTKTKIWHWNYVIELSNVTHDTWMSFNVTNRPHRIPSMEAPQNNLNIIKIESTQTQLH